MRKVLIMFSVLSSLITTACSEAAFGVVNIPAKLSDVKVIKDIAYGTEPLQNLDIYVPDNLGDNKAPVLVFIHGGRWTFGNKDQYAFVGDSFAKQGYITVMINHRKYPTVKFPTFVEDGAQAIAWVHKNITQYGGNKDLFLSGHSSGAHIGALITADARYLKAHGLTPDIINAFAGLAGPYDFEPKERDLKDMFAPPSAYDQMQVTTFIDGKEPPIYLLTGADDKTVYYANIEKLEKVITEQKGRVAVKVYKGLDHQGIMKDFTWVSTNDVNVQRDMIKFFEKYKN